MALYKWNGGGGAFATTSPWTVNGSTPQTPPGGADTADFSSGGSPTGGGGVQSISVEGPTTFTSGTFSTQSLTATADVTVNNGGDLSASGNVSFGGAFTAQGGGKLESGFAAFMSGAVSFDGAGTSFTGSAGFQARGTSQFSISNQAKVTTGSGPGDLDTVETGSFALNSGASLTVADFTTFRGTTWSVTQGATLTAKGGGNLSGAGLVGVLFNGTGSIDGATLTTSAGLTFGGQGFEGGNATGIGTFSNGAKTSAGVLILGDYHGDTGQFTLTGAGTTLNLASTASVTPVPGAALIGNDGVGTLLVQSGAVLNETCGPGGFAAISYASDGSGQATIDGGGSAWKVAGTLYVGRGGTGTLSARNRGSVSATTLLVAARATSGTNAKPSTLSVDGAGSRMTVTGDATIDTALTTPPTNSAGKPNGDGGIWSYGTSGIGQIAATGGGDLTIAGTLTLQAPTDPGVPVTVSIDSGGSIEVGGQSGGQANQFSVNNGGVVIGHGTIIAGASSGGSAPTGSIVNAGMIEAQKGTLALGGNFSGAGLTTIDATATLRLNGTVDASATITFGGAYTTSLVVDQAGAFGGTLTNFQQGDVLVLPNVTGIAIPTPTTVRYSGGTLSLGATGSFAITDRTDPNPTFGLKADTTQGTDVETTSLTTLFAAAFATYKKAFDAPAGYQILQIAPAENGFEAVAYVDINTKTNTNTDDLEPNIIIAYRGTSLNTIPNAIKNIISDTSFLGGTPNALLQRYAADAANFAQSIAGANPKALITLTGHSLGGALAQMVGATSNLAVAAFNAPGTGQLYPQLGGQLGAAVGLGKGGTNINYRIYGDQASLAGTELGKSFTIATTTPPAQTLKDLVVNIYNDHMDPAYGRLLDGSAYTPGLTGPNYISLLQAAAQGPLGANLFINLAVAAGIATVLDPGAGSSFTLSANAGSPTLASIDLPFGPGVVNYAISTETGSTFSAPVQVGAGVDFALPAGTHAVTFAPLDATGAPVTMPGGFFFTASFATAGQFTGTITETGAPLGAPVTAATHVILPNTGAANPLGILAPTDAQYPGATSLAVTATGLPGNGTVLFADGITPVALGAALTTTQLTGLTFKPNANSGGQSGSFTYAVTDPDLTTATGSAAIQTACFRAGTRIATARGDIPVEQLRVGDLVHASGAGLTPIKWIGHRTLDCRRHPRPADVRPVRVRAHAFSDGMPVRDLWLSPDHAIALYGVLIPIRTLINGTTIVQECVEEVTYYHVELPAHDILRAEGLPTESYLDLGNRSAFDNGGTMVTLHPDLATRLWARDACAELILGGPILTAVRQRLRIQAGWLHRAGAIFPSVVTGEESRTARVCHTANG